MFSVFRILLPLLVAVSMSSCGYHLQNAFVAPPGMERTYIESDNRYSAFHRAFEAELRRAGVEVSDSAANATAVFTLYFDDTAQRVLSVSARNVPTEYEVYYTITYRLDLGATTLLPYQTLTRTRNYTYDSTLVLGKAREEELLREAIVNDLVRIIMKQITTL